MNDTENNPDRNHPDQDPADGLRVGFIGLGLVGAPMAGRLADAGLAPLVWNRSPDKLAPVLARGAVAAESPRALTAAVDVVITCLTSADAVRAVVFGTARTDRPPGENAVAAAGAPGKVLVDCSSMRPDLTAAWAAELRERSGMGWVDAPVSGGVPGAEAGTLTVMAGGETGDVEKIRPLLAHCSRRLTHMGPAGSGQTTKLANQIVAGCTITVVAECIGFAARAGVDASRIPEALAGGFADSRVMQLFGPRFAAGAYEPPLGALETMIKDLDTVRDVARSAGAPVPMSSQALELMRMLAAHDDAGKDITVLRKLFGGDYAE